MIDFIYISFIGLSIIVGLIFTRKSSQLSYKLLVGFLIITFCNEVLCYILKQNRINTHLFYNIYYYFRFPFLGLVFYKLLTEQKIIANFIQFFWIISILLFFVCIYLYGIRKLHTIYLLSGGVFILLLCLSRFLTLLKNEEVTNPLRSPFFWISTGLFFYFLGVLPFLGVINFLVKQDIIFAGNQLVITKILSIFLYSLIALDYFIQWKQAKLEY